MAVNVKDAATAVAILAGLYLGWRVVKGVSAAGDAAGNAVSTVVDGAKSAAAAVGDAVGGAWDWASDLVGLGGPDENISQETADRVADQMGLYTEWRWYVPDGPIYTQTGKNTVSTPGNVVDGSSLGKSWTESGGGSWTL